MKIALWVQLTEQLSFPPSDFSDFSAFTYSAWRTQVLFSSGGSSDFGGLSVCCVSKFSRLISNLSILPNIELVKISWPNNVNSLTRFLRHHCMLTEILGRLQQTIPQIVSTGQYPVKNRCYCTDKSHRKNPFQSEFDLFYLLVSNQQLLDSCRQYLRFEWSLF